MSAAAAAAADDGDDGGGAGGVDAIWANGAAFGHGEDDLDGDGEDTRSPLRASPTAGAAASAAADADASLPPQPQQQRQKEIPEATLEMLESVVYGVPFADFCDRLEAVRAARGSAAKRDAMYFNGDFAERLNKKHEKLLPPGAPRSKPSLYALMQLILPKTDSRSGQYKVLEKTVAQLYCAALGLQKGTPDYERFNKYQSSSNAETKDFGTMLEGVLRSRLPSTRSTKTLRDVHKYLDRLASTGTDRKKKEELFVEFTNTLPARENKWLSRIILQDLKMGMKADSALLIFGKDGKERLDACCNLRRLCAEVALGINSGSDVEVLTPFEVHLAKRVKSASKALEEMRGEAFVIERKVDGERYCMHKKGDNLKIISRNCKPARHEYYAHFLDVIKTRVLAEDCVLDGEIVSLNNETKEHEAFGHNKTVATHKYQAYQAAGVAAPPSLAAAGGGGSIDRGDSNGSAAALGRGGSGAEEGRVVVADGTHELLYVAYDIVYLGGKGAAEAFQRAGLEPCAPHEVCKLPLSQRRKLLIAVIKQKQNVLELIQHKEVPAGLEEGRRLEILATFFQEAVEKGWEGVVPKRLSGPYQTGKKSREVGGWFKLKPDYGDMTEEFDLVLLAGQYGEGQYTGIAKFIMGVIVEEEGDDGMGGGGGSDGLLVLTGNENGGSLQRGASEGMPLPPPPPPPPPLGVTRAASSSSSSLALTQSASNLSRSGRGGGFKWPEYRGSNGKRFRFHSFARVSSRHLKDEDRAELMCVTYDGRRLVDGFWIEAKQEHGVPPWIMPWRPSKEDFPHLWLHPDHAVVISVKSAEIVPSKSYSLQYTLRFPRLTRLRLHDKARPFRVEDAMSLDEFRQVRERGPLHLLHIGQQAAAASAFTASGGAWPGANGGGGRKRQQKPKAPVNIIGPYALPEPVKAEGDVFGGLEAVVLPGTYRTTHPRAAEYLGKPLPKPPKARPGSASAAGSGVAAGTPVPVLEVAKDDVCRLLAKHGAKLAANAVVYKPPSDSQEDDEDDEEEGGAGNGKRKRGGSQSQGKKRMRGGALVVLGGRAGAKGGKEKAAKAKEPVKQDFLVGPSVSNAQLEAAMKKYEADIYTLDWLLDCIQASTPTHTHISCPADRRMEPKVEHLLAATEATQRRLRKSVDCYGDPLAEEGGVEELRKVLARLPSAIEREGQGEAAGGWGWRRCAREHLTTELELASLGKHNLFWRPSAWVFYLDRYADPGPPDPPLEDEDEANAGLNNSSSSSTDRRPLPFSTLDATAALLRLHGAVVSPTLHAEVTHVVLDKRCPQRFAVLKARLDELRRHPWEAREKLVLDRAWIEESAKACRVVDKEPRHFVSLLAPVVATAAAEGQEEEEEEEEEEESW